MRRSNKTKLPRGLLLFGTLFISLILGYSAGSFSLKNSEVLATQEQEEDITGQVLQASTGQDFYIDPNGNDGNDGSLNTPWKTIAKANQTVQPGDTVHIKAGTYTQTIQPVSSGLADQPITYKNYNNEEVIITGVNDGVNLANKSYIVIDGFKIINPNYFWVKMIPNSTHNIIQNCHMEEAKGYKGLYIQDGSDWNKILNNKMIAYNGPSDPIWCINSSYNLIEGNDISYGPHCSINVQGPGGGTIGNVVRNNRIWNPWHHTLAIWQNADYTLVEGNTLLDAGEDHTNIPLPPVGTGTQYDRDFPREAHNGIQLGSSNCILRHNIMVNDGSGIAMSSQGDGSVAGDNRIYHNTLYDNYIGIRTHTIYSTDGNIIKNNIFYNNKQQEIYRRIYPPATGNNQYPNNNVKSNAVEVYYYSTNLTILQAEGQYPNEFSNNLNFDPLFVDQANRDLHLQLSSPMINIASPLTTTAGSGSGTILEVKDAKYFSDGFGIVEADWIKIGDSAPVQIKSINYDTNIITLKESRSWVSGSSVNLYKDSSGNIVLSGSAPDIGAFEYGVDVDSDGQTIYLADQNDHSDIRPSLQAAVNSASDGDTIVLPAGEFYFDNEVYIDKFISIKGQGREAGGTKLYRRENLADSVIESYPYRSMMVFRCHQDIASNIILSDIYFKGKNPSQPPDYVGSVADDYAVKFENCLDFLVTNNRFEHFGHAAMGVTHKPTGASGVIYNNIFIDNLKWFSPDGTTTGYGLGVGGDNSTWLTDPGFGSQNFVFVEDNYFEGQRHAIAAGSGGLYVFRYNEVVNNLRNQAVDAHGANFPVHGYGNKISTRAYEVYNNNIYNTVYVDGTTPLDDPVPTTRSLCWQTACCAIVLRGGEGLIYGNRIDGFRVGIRLITERTLYNHNDDIYPEAYQIGYLSGENFGANHSGINLPEADGDIFIWDNDISLFQQCDPDQIYEVLNSGSAALIQEDRDYHLNTPKPNYTSYTYPHPLRELYSSTSDYDLNGDNAVDFSDIQVLLWSYNGSSYEADFNDDGKVNAFDFGVLILNLD